MVRVEPQLRPYLADQLPILLYCDSTYTVARYRPFFQPSIKHCDPAFRTFSTFIKVGRFIICFFEISRPPPISTFTLNIMQVPIDTSGKATERTSFCRTIRTTNGGRICICRIGFSSIYPPFFLPSSRQVPEKVRVPVSMKPYVYQVPRYQSNIRHPASFFEFSANKPILTIKYYSVQTYSFDHAISSMYVGRSTWLVLHL